MPSPRQGQVPSTKMQVTIGAPNIETLSVAVVGTSPYMQHAFSQKVQEQMRAKHEAGESSRKNQKRAARDFNSDYEQAKHTSQDGWLGIPAPAFRNALISACRVCGFAMTRAKLSLFIEADGHDSVTGDPLVKIQGKPEKNIREVRNDSGVVLGSLTFEVLIEGEPEQVPYLLNVVYQDEEESRVYMRLREAQEDPDIMSSVVEKALQDLRNWRRRYARLKELSGLHASIDPFLR